MNIQNRSSHDSIELQDLSSKKQDVSSKKTVDNIKTPPNLLNHTIESSLKELNEQVADLENNIHKIANQEFNSDNKNKIYDSNYQDTSLKHQFTVIHKEIKKAIEERELLGLSPSEKESRIANPTVSHPLEIKTYETPIVPKDYKSSTAKAVWVGMKEFAGGVGQMLAGVETCLVIAPILALTGRGKDASAAPLIITEGFNKAKNAYSVGKQISEDIQKTPIKTKEDFARYETRKKILDKASELFKEEKFVKFLDEKWPKDKQIPNHYDVDLLGEYINVYEKQNKLDKIDEDIKTKADNIGSNIKERTEYEIVSAKLSRAQAKLEKHQAKHDKILNEIKEFGKNDLDELDVSSPEQLNATKELAIKTAKGKNFALNQVKLQETEKEIEENAAKIKTLKLDVKYEESKVEKNKDLEIPKPRSAKVIRDNIVEYFKDTDKEITRQGQYDRDKKNLASVKKELSEAEQKHTELKNKKSEILKQIEENETFLTQKFAALDKENATIKALNKIIVNLEKSKNNFNPNTLEDNTAISKTEQLKLENDKLRADLALAENEKFDDTHSFESFKNKDNKYIFYQDILDDSIEKNVKNIQQAQKNQNKIEELKEENKTLQKDNLKLEENLKTIELLEKSNKEHETKGDIFEKEIGELESKLKPLLNLEKQIKKNNQKIRDLADQVEKEKNIQKAINPNFDKINDLKQKYQIAAEALRNQGLNDIEAIDKKIQELEANNQGGVNQSKINELKKNKDIFLNTDKEIEKLYDEISPTKNEIDAELYAIQKRTAIKQDETNGPDLRPGNLDLKKWQGKPIQSNQANVNFDAKNTEGNIYIFGTHNERPTHGIHNMAAGLEGEYLWLSENDRRALGRTDSNNFLSNSYNQPVTIDGKEYKTVTHYLIYKRIEKSREVANSSIPVKRKTLVQLKQLEKIIDKTPTAFDATWFYNWSNNYRPILKVNNVGQMPTMFHDLDDELKKALYCKFVGRDGRPNEEGRKLIATGNIKLYAGNELGDPSYGMQFLKKGEMTGQNKLGECLMELREMLRYKEAKLNRNEWENRDDDTQPTESKEIPVTKEEKSPDTPSTTTSTTSTTSTTTTSTTKKSNEKETLTTIFTSSTSDSILTNKELRFERAGINLTPDERNSNENIVTYHQLEDGYYFEGLLENGKPSKGSLFDTDRHLLYIGKFVDGKPSTNPTDGTHNPIK